MQDNPPPEQILDIAIAHLRDSVLPTLSGRAVFDMRVTISALELVRRSIALTPESDAAERERLSALLGQDSDLETLNRALCERIAAGALDLNSPGLAAHLGSVFFRAVCRADGSVRVSCKVVLQPFISLTVTV